jgi:thiamine-phosphate pyrophosphorylase
LAKSYYITSRHFWHEDPVASLQAKVREAVAAEIDFLQIREKDMPASALYQLSAALANIAEGSKTQLLVNGRADIAAATGISGLHLSATELPLAALRKSQPQLQFIGVSCHNEKEAEAVEAAGVDYILLGPVFETPSKPGAWPVGLQRLARICRSASVPVFALGGLSRVNAASCVQAGAAGVAGIRLFQEEENLRQLVAEIRQL